MRKSWLIPIALSLALSLAVPLLYGGLDSLRALRQVSPAAVLGLLGLVVLGWGFNAARIRLLAASLGSRLGRRDALTTVVAAEFAGVATPVGAGNPATYLVLLSRQGLKLGDAAAVTAVDRLTDLVFFGTAMPVAVLLFAVDGGIDHPLRLAGLMLGLLLVGFALLLGLARHSRALVLLAGRWAGRVPRLRRLRLRAGRAALNFRRSLRLLLGMGPRRMALLYLFCLGHWMIRYGILPLILWHMGADVHWGYLFAMQAALLFIGQLTLLPGGGGGVELGFSALLAPYLDATASASALLLWRFCTFYWYLLAGAPAFVVASGAAAGSAPGLARLTLGRRPPQP